MHHYDIAAKVLIDICRDEILRRFLHLDVRQSTLIESLPQETVSVKRSDFPMKVINAEGRQNLVILEIQTQWNSHDNSFRSGIGQAAVGNTVSKEGYDDRIRRLPFD